MKLDLQDVTQLQTWSPTTIKADQTIKSDKLKLEKLNQNPKRPRLF